MVAKTKKKAAPPKLAQKKKAPAKKAAERRLHKRHEAKKLWIKETSGDYLFVNKVVDLSEGGVFLKSKMKTTREPSMITIPMKATGQRLQLKAMPLYDRVSNEKTGTGYRFMDVSPAQIAGLGLALIPFAAMNDPNRTLIGSKTQTQAVPLVHTQAPIVGTGFERIAARTTGRSIYAEADGVVKYVDAERVIMEYKGESGKPAKKEYEVEAFVRTNQSTSFSQRAAVTIGQEVKKLNSYAMTTRYFPGYPFLHLFIVHNKVAETTEEAYFLS